MDDIYREYILDHYRDPRNHGHLEHPTIAAGDTNPLCGDRIELDLNVSDDRVTEVRFSGRGCAISQASASMLTERIEGATLESFDRVFAINARAPLFIAQRALRTMPSGGRIINVSSGVTWFSIPEVVYSMTKGALNVMTRSLALTQGPRGITVNGVSPGITATDMNGWLVDNPGAEVEIDLANMTLRLPNGSTTRFPIDSFARYCLLNGIDELGYLLGNTDRIAAFEQRHL